MIAASSSSGCGSNSEFRVHRLRIGNWVPSPIKCIASDPFSSRIAVGREDGDIEICDASCKWYCQAVIPGMKDFSLRCLEWSPLPQEKGRLFGVSTRGFIFEVDFAALKIKDMRDSYGGAVWCMSMSPRETTIAIGCEDGCLRLFRYDGVGLEYHKALPMSTTTSLSSHAKTATRVLSVADHPCEARLFAGCSEGPIRCMDEVS